MYVGEKWGYSARKNSRKFREGFDNRKRDRCSFHGHRMCYSPVPDDMTTHKKRANNKQLITLNLDTDYDIEYEEDSFYVDEEIPEEIEYGEDYENDEFDSDVEEMNELDVAYVEYEKMRNDEINLDDAYAGYQKMKDDEWILLESEN